MQLTIEALIVVLDGLLSFNFEPNYELSGGIQAELVRSHMRIAYSVPKHYLYFQSGYPSEPLLAEAAAQQLLTFKEKTGGCLSAMADMLHKTSLLQTTLIDSGQRGEVFMRMCLMGAYMDGVLQELWSDPRRGIVFSKGCKLTTFIERLFEPTYARMVLDARPDNLESDMTFSEAFAHSMVRFTHFVEAGDAYAMTSEALFAAFTRGMAFIGYPTQQAADFAIPVLLNKDDTLQESAMSATLIRIKRRVKGCSPCAYTFSEDEVGLFPPEAEARESQGKGKGKAEESLDDKRPYITLVAEVCIEPQEGNMKTPTVHVSQRSEPIHYHSDVHPRYAIVAYGCTGVYNQVDGSKYAFFLATRDFFTEHPNYWVARSRDLAMRLKPFWWCGENSYHWLDSELLG